jgi:hypothetical protein
MQEGRIRVTLSSNSGFFVAHNTNIQTVDHKFLISDHSFTECGQNFGLIEKAKRATDRKIFVPQDWETLWPKIEIHCGAEESRFHHSSMTHLWDLMAKFYHTIAMDTLLQGTLSETAPFFKLNLKSHQAGRKEILKFLELKANVE